MILAIVPARGGSKRIPKKNIKPFFGKPIIAYSIEVAINTGIFDKIIVSTDSIEIARVARQYGAETPFMRPAELSDDHTGTDAVVLHALNELKNQGFSAEFVCCIYATAPFISAKFIRKGFNLLKKHQATSAFSVTTFSYPIFRALKVKQNERVAMIWPEYQSSRSQDLPEAYHDAGQFYWARVHNYLEEKKFFSQDALPVILPRYMVQDIDTPEDWQTAERMYLAMNSTSDSKPQ